LFRFTFFFFPHNPKFVHINIVNFQASMTQHLRITSFFMKKILILNADLGTQMQIYLALCDAYQIEIAENIDAVMYYLRKMRPEILVLDYNLEALQTNGRTGADVLRKVKKKYQDLKVVLLVDGDDRKHEIDGESDTADSILFKPIKNRNLISSVKKLAEIETASLVS